MKYTRHTLAARLAALPLLFATAGPAAASLIAQDQFLGGWEPEAGEYESGFILGQNPTLPGWSVPWTKPDWGDPNRLEFNPAGLLYRNLDCRGGHAEALPNTRVGRVLDAPFTDASSDTVYLSFLMRVPNPSPFDYDPGSKTYRLTWNSQPDRSYTLRYTTDLALPGTVAQSGILSAGATTTWPPVGDPPAASPLPAADRLFFFLEEIPE